MRSFSLALLLLALLAALHPAAAWCVRCDWGGWGRCRGWCGRRLLEDRAWAQ